MHDMIVGLDIAKAMIPAVRSPCSATGSFACSDANLRCDASGQLLVGKAMDNPVKQTLCDFISLLRAVLR